MSDAIWINGQRNTSVSALDRGLAYGDGLFATMRCQGGEIAFLENHLLRLAQGAKRLGIPWQATQALRSQLAEACAQGDTQYSNDFCLKLLISRGVGGRGYMPPQSPQLTEVISLHEIPAHYRQWQETGIRLQTSQVRLAKQALLAGIKHLNRLEQVLIRAQALAEGFDDWLVCDTDTGIVEASMANLFFIQGQTLVTPSLHFSGVAGVMREQLILWFVAAGFNVEARQVLPSELAKFDHVLASNSLFGAVGITQIDNHSFSLSPLLANIRQELKLTL
ncbi:MULTISPECIES: aminodeoxychorismate lyase [Shewanella]|uniref:Aminodeoxychorismate lyase n=1 Tax=Shewanella marisflavi TaxID=260364 RepID=A0ABX5WMA0_9GAMM|nr:MULTISPECIES: aminodeoxychorismate lyase [Shewanella]MCL1042285.1 aminodeoxychorismate lyase [Shewanella marisflavi]QDF75692.1 aminodeoxychorismate lyase [Shewanella marisflavi]